MKMISDKRYLLIALLAIGLASGAACPDARAGADYATAAAASNGFGFDLFARLNGEKLEKNIFISPYSISTALTMTWSGARGATARAMARALRLDDEPSANTLASCNALRQQLSADTAVTLDIANSLWLRQSFPLKQEFQSRAQQYFGAMAATLDFADPSATAGINDWVSSATHGKITKIIDRIGPEMMLYLINAVYFKGTWQAQFDPARTREQEFYPLAGPARLCPLMHQSGHYLYLAGAGFQAVKLPYRGDGTAMYVFLPAAKDGIRAFRKRLTDANWRKWTAALTRRTGEVALPRFTATYEAEFSRQLRQLGMGGAFSDHADFSGISDQGLAISEVRHKALLEVNEEGTVAAAVTSVGMRTTSVVVESPPFTMIVDHPFFLAIADEATGTILFMGVIVDPQ